MTASTASKGSSALALVRLHDLIAAGGELLEKLAHDLEEYDPRTVGSSGVILASPGRQNSIVASIEELLDLVEHAYHAREPLLRRECAMLDVDTSALIEAAAEWLVEGIADERQVKLAASLLPAPDGPLAFARALMSSEHLRVSDATVGDVLRAFPDGSDGYVDRIVAAAQIDTDAPLRSLDATTVEQLVRALIHEGAT